MHYFLLVTWPDNFYWFMLLFVALVIATERIRHPHTQWRSRDDQIAWGQREKGR